MKFNKNAIFNIAKSRILNANTKLEPLDYKKWQEFVENYNEYFIWNENTEEGKKRLQNIDNVPEEFKCRVLARLSKGVCFLRFNNMTKLYDISITFYCELNWITIQFAHNPKIEELKLFLDMANYLDAYLLYNGNEIIDEKVIESLE